jgi:hypothetical protein
VFSRFYLDVDLVLDWDPRHREALKASGNALPSESLYFRPGLTWPLVTVKGLNVRVMPAGCVFGHKGPAVFPKHEDESDYLLGVLNSTAAEYLARAMTPSRSWEVGVIQKLPIPRAAGELKGRIAWPAHQIHDAKARWDEGNEVSTRFKEPWLAAALRERRDAQLNVSLEAVIASEASADAAIQTAYAELDAAVFEAYGLSSDTRETVLKDLGERPIELIWPQMEGRNTEQKRMEHIWRLLSFCVKRVIESDDAIVPLVTCSNELPLEERVLAELEKIVGVERLHDLEGEVASELRKRAPGYKRADSIGDWLTNIYFEHHVRLYKSRPIYWHLASSQKVDPAFGAIVHYHRFGKDALRKLRGGYVRGYIERLEHDLGYARNEKRADDAVELQQKIDEVRAFDKQLQRFDEGEFPIRVPWKDAAAQPKGWNPDIDDGVRVNILPLQTAGLLRIAKVVPAKTEDEE